MPNLNYAPHYESITGVEAQLHVLSAIECSSSYPGHFIPRQSLLYPLSKWLGDPQNWSWRFGERKKCRLRLELNPRTPRRPTSSLVTVPTELSWLTEEVYLIYHYYGVRHCVKSRYVFRLVERGKYTGSICTQLNMSTSKLVTYTCPLQGK